MWVVIAVIAAPLLIFIIIFNTLVVKRNRAENAFATIDVMLKKRYDLIPNLASAVRGYAAHESATMREVVSLRAQAVSGVLNMDQEMAANDRITEGLRRILVAIEAYPDLKASGHFMHLQRSLVELEEQISAARRAYNAAVTSYNDSVAMFPSNLVAGMFGFRRHRLFSAGPEEQRVPEAGSLLDQSPDG